MNWVSFFCGFAALSLIAPPAHAEYCFNPSGCPGPGPKSLTAGQCLRVDSSGNLEAAQCAPCPVGYELLMRFPNGGYSGGVPKSVCAKDVIDAQ